MGTRKRAASPPRTSTAYACDYWSWTMDQARALSEVRMDDLDLPHLAEEIADLGKSEEHRLESELARLLEHLLKLVRPSASVRQQNARGWSISASNARWRARRVIAKNPGLKSKLAEIFADAYHDARDGALIALNLQESEIRRKCRWSFEEVMAEGFLPD
jgi:hypothetical protein